MMKIKEAAKMLAALIGAVVTSLAALIPADWNVWVGLVLAVLTAIATYSIPNAPAAPPAETPEE